MTERRRSLAMQRWLAHQEIDALAAEVRGRSMAPGMDLVYAVKLDQALAYLDARRSNPQAEVPSYVRADMEVDGTSAAAAAQAIVTASKGFHDTTGPAIEKARREGKRAVSAAADSDALADALAAAMQALRAI